MLQRILRTSLISLSKASWAQRTVTHWGIAWRVASRFVAGDTLEKAISAIRTLNSRGLMATLDHLGEHTTSVEDARGAVNEVLEALGAIDVAGVRSNVSIKLSQIGLILDENLCRDHLAQILARAQELNTFVRIDMEDSHLTAQTLACLAWARAQGFDNVGIVIQAYLYRSAEDLAAIISQAGHVRLCKGAYDEPAAVAFPAKKDVDRNYDRLATDLISGACKAGAPRISANGRIPPLPAFATHDLERIRFIQEEAQRQGMAKDAYEFQMLFGIRRDLQDALVGEGYLVRIYVPYGTHWYPYFMRRLAERPANIWFFVSNFFRK
jgi:proline dehydrogenase